MEAAPVSGWTLLAAVAFWSAAQLLGIIAHNKSSPELWAVGHIIERFSFLLAAVAGVAALIAVLK